MISRRHRFSGSGGLRRVYARGQTVRGPLFSVRYAPNDRTKYYRLAVVVSRKVCKSAVKRNRIRRRLYSAVRELASGVEQPFDIVITVFHDSILHTPHQDLTQQLKRQLKSADILK